MPTLRINDLDFYYDIAGSGEPMVFISGVSSDHVGWKATQLPDFTSAGFRCLLFDNRDVGQTGESLIESYSTRQFADDTAKLIRKLEFGPAHIVGASMGGMIAQELALNYPDCVRTLTLVCTTARPDRYMRNVIEAWKTASSKYTREQFLQARMPWIFTHRFYDKTDLMESYKRRVLANPYPQTVPGFHRQCDAILTHDTLDSVAQDHVSHPHRRRCRGHPHPTQALSEPGGSHFRFKTDRSSRHRTLFILGDPVRIQSSRNSLFKVVARSASELSRASGDILPAPGFRGCCRKRRTRKTESPSSRRRGGRDLKKMPRSIL